MGNCCGEQEDKTTNVNIKDKKTGGKGVGADPYQSSQPVDSQNILDFTNDRVRELYQKMGEYKNQRPKDDRTEVETKPICSLENNARYHGEWSKKGGSSL